MYIQKQFARFTIPFRETRTRIFYLHEIFNTVVGETKLHTNDTLEVIKRQLRRTEKKENPIPIHGHYIATLQKSNKNIGVYC